jgi:tRNA 2-thiouridine synthesizing protein A
MGHSPKVLNVDKHIDCTGLFCPLPIVRIREAIRDLRPGQLVEMLSDDPGSEPDMKAWSRRSGHELVEVTRDGAVFRFVVRKRG